MKEKYVIVWGDSFVGVDSPSGGYPYKTNNPSSVAYWNTYDEALKYLEMFNRSTSYGLTFDTAKVQKIEFLVS